MALPRAVAPGLGVVATRANRVTNEMFLAAARSLAALVTPDDLAIGRVYPALTRIREVSASYGLKIDPERRVGTLSVGERQRVEIVRALLTNPKLLILDEPTSVLTPQAVEKLFVVLRKLAALLLAERRSTDVVCRYGGEELTYLLDNADAEVVVMAGGEHGIDLATVRARVLAVFLTDTLAQNT